MRRCPSGRAAARDSARGSSLPFRARRTTRTPNAFATPSIVTSSCVGPTPPDVKSQSCARDSSRDLRRDERRARPGIDHDAREADAELRGATRASSARFFSSILPERISLPMTSAAAAVLAGLHRLESSIRIPSDIAAARPDRGRLGRYARVRFAPSSEGEAVLAAASASVGRVTEAKSELRGDAPAARAGRTISIITDINMGDINGLELIALRTQERAPPGHAARNHLYAEHGSATWSAASALGAEQVRREDLFAAEQLVDAVRRGAGLSGHRSA